MRRAWLFAVFVFGAEAQPPGQFPLHNLEVDTEVTWASDIFLAESGARFEQEWSRLRWDLNLTHNLYSLGYEPFHALDFFGFPETLYEDRLAGQATVRLKITDTLTFIASGGLYEGFQDYRRVWLNNYYRQQYHHPNFPTRPGYEEAHPKGWNASAGLRWEYWRERGFVEARGTYAVDEVAPGYVEEAGQLIRGGDTLYTYSGGLAFENVLSSRLRALNELRISDTTLRDMRVSWQSSLNCAIGERWIARALGGYTAEEPTFQAYWAGVALEFQAASWCALLASANWYQDTGEILDPLLLSSAAPGLESYQASLGVRFTWSRFVVKLAGGPYYTDYEEVPFTSRPFFNLYRDRNWVLAQVTLGLAF